MGYKNVYVYDEGLPEWVKRGYPAEIKEVYPKPKIPFINAADLKGMIDRKENIYLLDLRDEDDRKAGWIKGSKHIDMEILDESYADLPKDRKLVLIDLLGKQSYMAARFLTSKGYKDISMLEGGFVGGWLKAGYQDEH